MNGDTLCWVLVQRTDADGGLGDQRGGGRIPVGALQPSREAADAAAVEIGLDEAGKPKVVVAELIDRRAS